MKLNELLLELATGDLSNLAFAKTGVIEDAAHVKVINAINTALNDIFSRICLAEKEVLVETLDWKATYFIRPEHARMDPTPDVLKYILDTPANPFKGDLVKVLGVCNEVGDPLPVNDAQQWASVFLPAYDTVQFNHPGAKQVFSVQYQALHPKLATSGTGYLDQPIRVPSMLMDMVKLKTAATLLSPMGGQTETSKAQMLEAKYEARHESLVLKNDVGDTGLDTNVKLMRRGYP